MRAVSRFLMPLGFVLALSACSGGEPSEADMAKAAATMIEESLEQMRQLTGGSLQADNFEGFDGFTKETCTKLEGNQGYRCSFSFTATMGGRTETSKQTGRFYQTERGWVVELGT